MIYRLQISATIYPHANISRDECIQTMLNGGLTEINHPSESWKKLADTTTKFVSTPVEVDTCRDSVLSYFNGYNYVDVQSQYTSRGAVGVCILFGEREKVVSDNPDILKDMNSVLTGRLANHLNTLGILRYQAPPEPITKFRHISVDSKGGSGIIMTFTGCRQLNYVELSYAMQLPRIFGQVYNGLKGDLTFGGIAMAACNYVLENFDDIYRDEEGELRDIGEDLAGWMSFIFMSIGLQHGVRYWSYIRNLAGPRYSTIDMGMPLSMAEKIVNLYVSKGFPLELLKKFVASRPDTREIQVIMKEKGLL